MSREIWEIVQKMETEDIELQLALQCAPLITGLKTSNLLNIQREGYQRVKELVKDSHISFYPLLVSGQKVTILLYNARSLEAYFWQEKVVKLLHSMGYEGTSLEEVLPVFRARYQNYMQEKKEFPHELGLLLGYPVEDVEGFIKHEGRNSLCTGYWKVYEDQAAKKKIFEQFEYAKENLIQLLSYGISMAEIIAVCGCSIAKLETA